MGHVRKVKSLEATVLRLKMVALINIDSYRIGNKYIGLGSIRGH
jgi:hypothetical protein